MKRYVRVFIVIGILVLGAAVFLLTTHVSGKFLTAKKGSKAACQHSGSRHAVVIANDKVEPAHITAARCDTLTITNNDDKLREMAFGVHDNHVAYDGISVKTLTKGQDLTVTLNKTGTYLFHDHHQDEVAGDFTVK
jgi:hypothetical protein